jgi:rubrerythrin
VGEQRIERRLAAILAADGRLIGATEIGALRVLIRLPKEIVDPALTAHAGSIVKLTGDGIFIKFTSAVDAVACAVEVQRALVYGDSVNVAARFGDSAAIAAAGRPARGGGSSPLVTAGCLADRRTPRDAGSVIKRGVRAMSSLKGTKTEENLKYAFAGEALAKRRYLYFAQKADVEGYDDVSAVFRLTAEGKTGHAHGHLEYLDEVGNPATAMPSGDTRENLQSAIADEAHEYTDMYPGMAKTARHEGFDEIADWFETLAKAEKSYAGRLQKALDTLG